MPPGTGVFRRPNRLPAVGIYAKCWRTLLNMFVDQNGEGSE
jgi:hypothetical protein